MAGRLEGRVAIVTGAGRGVGRGIALLMAREGAKVVVADNGSQVDGSGRSSGPADEVVAEIVAAGGTALSSVTDVSDWDEAERLIATPIETWGKLDILVNCAGNLVRDTIADVTAKNLAAIRRVHFDGQVYTSHFAALHWFERGEYGRLINFTSDAGILGVPDTFSYAASKGGVMAFTRAAAQALANYNATANAMTQMSRSRMSDFYFGPDEDGNLPTQVAGPEEQPETVAPLVVYLASPAAAGISGRVFGSYGYKYVRWSEREHERVLESDGPWDLDRVFEAFPDTLGEGLSIEDGLPLALDSIEPSDKPAGARIARTR
jgi:NAD(P)-dependent dehydrogenase (short-subunit alcohol dehydrogenase family)